MKSTITSLSLALALQSITTFAQKPAEPALNFGIFSRGDVQLKNHESAAPVAVGGNLTTSQYQISFEKRSGIYFVKGSSIALAVAGGVNLENGSLMINGSNYVKIGDCAANNAGTDPLKVWYKDNNNAVTNISIGKTKNGYNSSPNILINANINAFTVNGDPTTNPVCENVFGTGANQINMDEAFSSLIANSQTLSTLTDNLSIRDQNGKINPNAPMGPYLTAESVGQNPKIIVDPTKINVLTVSAEVWDKLGNVNMEGMPQGYQPGTTTYTGAFGLIINIVNFNDFAKKSDAIRFPQIGGLSSGQGGLVLFNFPDADQSITIATNSEINGTLLAPKAYVVKKQSNNINGQVIVRGFEHLGGQINFYPSLISAPLNNSNPDPIIVTASSRCQDNAPYLSYEVQGVSQSRTSASPATIEWINSNGSIIQQNQNQPLHGEILFPGTEISDTGETVAYPGWKKNNGNWNSVNDSLASIINPGARIRVTVGASQLLDITYPTSTTGCLTAPTSSLPVKLSSFSVTNVNCKVELKWKVTEATNFSHFVVQRSADGRNYQDQGQINYVAGETSYAATNSPYSSDSPVSKKWYYRLKQVDLDGSVEYSTIKAVDASTCDSRLRIELYPNPVEQEMNIASHSAIKTLEILNGLGQKVLTKSPGSQQYDLKIDVGNFKQGLYILRVVNAEGEHSHQWLKN